MARQLYDYWFVQFDFPDENGRPYKSSGGAMVWNEKLKREIPVDWSCLPIGEIIDILDSKRVPLSSKERIVRQGEYPYYGATGIMDYIDDYLFDEDIILLAEDGSTSDSNGNPIVQYVWGKVWVNNHAHIILPKCRSQKVYLYFLLKAIQAKKIESGSIQKKISQANLCNHFIAIPQEEIISEYTKVVNPLWSEWKRTQEEINNLTALRDELLPLLMNGQVSVRRRELNCDLLFLMKCQFSDGFSICPVMTFKFGIILTDC